MSEITLVYTGPLEQCGLEGKGGRSYLVQPLVPFTVDPDDAAFLLGRFPGVLKPFESERIEPEPVRRHRARHTAPDDQEASANDRDSDQDSES